MKNLRVAEYGLDHSNSNDPLSRRDDGATGGSRVLKASLNSESTTIEPTVDMRLAKSLVPMKSMTDAHLAELLKNSAIETVFQGHTLFSEGSYDNQVIYLLHGELELIYANAKDSELVTADALMPIANKQPRPCRAIARTDCSVMRVDAEYLDKMLCWSQVAEYLLLDISYQRDLDEDVEWMMTILKSNLFFKVPPTNAHMIFDRLQTAEVEAGGAVVRQGEIGDNCYFIKQGRAEVRRSMDNRTPPVPIAEIGPGRCFGEDALVFETVRNATVVMKTDGVLMYLSKRNFLKLLKEPKVASVDAKELEEHLAEGAICIDVRTEEEYAAGHLDKAINIPLNLLRIKTRLLDPEAKYVIYCDTGRRSRAAAFLLSERKFSALALGGGLRALRPELVANLQSARGYLLKEGKVVAAAE